MPRLAKLLTLFLVLILSFHQVIAAQASEPFSKETLSISFLEQNTAIYAGTWIANSQERAFLLLGNEKEMWLAVALQAGDGTYQIIAQSNQILSYEDYRAGHVEMLDKWDNGNPYFWYSTGNDTQIYITISDAGDDAWSISSGVINSFEKSIDFNFYISDSKDSIIVYETCYPQIQWPIGDNMRLEGFDITIIKKESLAALEYLDKFQQTHQLNDLDTTYKIIWE